MSNGPSLNGRNGNGRDRQGRFARGNPGGPGNPLAQKVNRLRGALLDAVTERDFRAVVRKIVAAAKQGEPWAVRELLDRLLGRPQQALELSSPDGTLGMQTVVAAVLQALDGFPDAKVTVAARLKAMAATGRSDDAGSGV